MSKKRPQIPPAKFSGQLSALNAHLNAIREQNQINQGERGDPLDRVITVRDLTESGIANFKLSKRGGTQYIDVVDPTTDIVTSSPPTPTGLEARGTTATVYLTWDAPAYPYHAYTEVWRSSENNLSTAVNLGASSPYSYYADPVDAGSTHYYWIRFVSTAGKESPYNDVDGVEGTTHLSPDVVLDALSERITKSQLVQELRADIELIPNLAEGINQEAIDRSNQVLEESQKAFDAIATERSSRIDSIQSESRARENAILAESRKRVSDFQALQAIEALSGNDVRQIILLDKAATEERSSIQSYQELSASLETEKGKTSSEIIRLEEATATETEARISSINEMAAKFETDLGEIKEAAVSEAVNIVVTDDDVIAEVISKISAADTNQWATISYIQTSAITPLNALSSQMQALESQYQSLDESYVTHSLFNEWQQTYTDEYSASTERLDSLESTLENPTTGLSSKASNSQLLQTKNDIYNSSVSRFGSINATFQNKQVDIDSRATKVELDEAVASVDDVNVKRMTQTVTSLKKQGFESEANELKLIDQQSSSERSQLENLEKVNSKLTTEISQANSSILETKTALGDELSSLVETVSEHKSTYETDKANTLASKSELSTAIATEQEARVTLSATINTEFNSKQQDIDSKAERSELTEAISNIKGASVSEFSQINAEFNNKQNEINSKASKTELSEAVASESNARSTQVYQLNTALSGHNATLVSHAESLNGIWANWAVKFKLGSDGNYRVSGFGIAASPSSTAAHFDVDEFSISKPGAEKLDFAVADVLQPDGSTKRMVVMDAASIVNLVVTNAMISDIAADKITTGKISAARIDVDSLRIGNANVAGDLYSNNYQYGQAGWRLYQNGYADLNNVNVRGTLTADDIVGDVNITQRAYSSGTVWVSPNFQYPSGDFIEICRFYINLDGKRDGYTPHFSLHFSVDSRSSQSSTASTKVSGLLARVEIYQNGARLDSHQFGCLADGLGGGITAVGAYTGKLTGSVMFVCRGFSHQSHTNFFRVSGVIGGLA